MHKKRSSEMIIENVLEACSEGSCKTRIIYQSNLNSTTVKPYINLLIDNDLIEVDEPTGAIFKTTKKGCEFMNSLKKHHDEISKLTSLLAPAFVVFWPANLWINGNFLNFLIGMFSINPPL